MNKNIFVKDEKGNLVFNKHYEYWGKTLSINFQKKVTENVTRNAESIDGAILNSYFKTIENNIKSSSSLIVPPVSATQNLETFNHIKSLLFPLFNKLFLKSMV